MRPEPRHSAGAHIAITSGNTLSGTFAIYTVGSVGDFRLGVSSSHKTIRMVGYRLTRHRLAGLRSLALNKGACR
jgi:hypothetical protein